MLNLQETIALNNLEHAINNASEIGCDSTEKDCSICPFRYTSDDGGFSYSCTIWKMRRLLDYIRDNNMEENDTND